MPFTPPSPLLSCSQEGSRHTVTSPPCAYGTAAGMWGGWGCEFLSPPALSCVFQSKLSRHGSGADSDYENTQSGDPLLG